MTDFSILLKLVSLGLGHTTTSSCDTDGWQEANWAELLVLAKKQHLAAVASDGMNSLVNAGKLQMDRKMLFNWLGTAIKSEQMCTKQKSTLQSLASFYGENHIKMMILKGYGLSMNYPDPQHRPGCDVDIYLFGKHKEADELLKSRGVKVRDAFHHHTVFDYHGVHVENHFDFLNIHSQKSNVPYERKLKSLANTGYLQTDIDNAYIPSPDFNALFILRHTAAHFAAVEMVLRQVVDWGTFIEKYGDRVKWSEILPFIKDANMYDFLICVNTICTDYLDFPKDNFPELESRPELARRVLDDMLSPEFDEDKPKSGLLRILSFKLRRWKSNIWKRKLVYSDSQLSMFFTQFLSHLQKPASIRI